MEEGKKGLVLGIGRDVREEMASGSIGQVSVGLSKIIIQVEDHSSTTLVCRLES